MEVKKKQRNIQISAEVIFFVSIWLLTPGAFVGSCLNRASCCDLED